MIGPRGRAGAVLLAVFAAGAFSGTAYERHRKGHAPIVVSMESDHAAALGELREILELDDGQVEQLHVILNERQEVVQQMWEQLRPEVQQAITEVHEEFAAILRPDQRARFHRWLRHQRQQQHPDASR